MKLAAAGGLALALVLPGSAWSRRADTITVGERTALARDALRMACDAPLTGIGLEAFGAAYPPYQSVAKDLRFRPSSRSRSSSWSRGRAAPAARARGRRSRSSRSRRAVLRSTRDPLTKAVAVSAVAVPIHACCDFPLRVPGVAVPFLLTLGTLLALADGAPRARARRRQRRREARISKSSGTPAPAGPPNRSSSSRPRVSCDGAAVTLAAPDAPGFAPRVAAAGARFVPVAMASRRDWRSFAALTGLLRRGEFDVVHTHCRNADLHGGLAARATGTPHVAHLRGLLVDETGAVGRGFVDRLHRALLRRSPRRIVAVSEAVRRRALALLGVAPERRHRAQRRRGRVVQTRRGAPQRTCAPARDPRRRAAPARGRRSAAARGQDVVLDALARSHRRPSADPPTRRLRRQG